MQKTIVVLGATGVQGGAVVKRFVALGWRVVGVTRSKDSGAARALAEGGVRVVGGSLDEPDSLVAAFRGAHVVFGVTDFWAAFGRRYAELSKVSDRATGEYAAAVEFVQGKNLIDAVERVLKEDGTLERFIWSTLPSQTELSKGKYTHSYHFDGKAKIAAYLKSKAELWGKSSLLNMGFYTTNWIKFGGLMAGVKDPGSETYILRKPGANEALHPLVVPTDAGLFVDLLVRSPPCQDLLGVSEFASYETYMLEWSRATGRPSACREISVEEQHRAQPGGLGRETAESAATSAEFGWGEGLVVPWELDPEIKTTSLREYMEAEDWEAWFAKEERGVRSGL